MIEWITIAELKGNPSSISPKMVSAPYCALHIVRVLDDRGDGRYDFLLSEPGPSSENSIVGTVGTPEARDVGGIRPFEERSGELPWPENSDYMMDVAEVNIAEAFSLRQCSKEALPRLVSKPAEEEEHDLIRAKLRDAAHDLGESLADGRIVLEDDPVLADMIRHMQQAIAVAPPGRTRVSAISDYIKVLNWQLGK